MINETVDADRRMTHDRKDDSKSSKEKERSSKKSDSSAAVITDKTASTAEGLPTKVNGCRPAIANVRYSRCIMQYQFEIIHSANRSVHCVRM